MRIKTTRLGARSMTFDIALQQSGDRVSQSSNINTLYCDGCCEIAILSSRSMMLSKSKLPTGPISFIFLLLPISCAMQEPQKPQGFGCSGDWQFNALANIRAEDVFPVPWGP
uniref:Uncharacterized protein n=1 Tax=Opuntia streptacantha TaxID=393608 RepID=A0A7C8YZR6_OPUST